MHLPVEIQTKAIPLLADPPFVFLLFWLAAALGYRALKGLKAPLTETTHLERGLLCTAFGLGMLQFVGFGLGAAGILSTTTLLIALLALVVWNIPLMLRLARVAWSRRQVLTRLDLWTKACIVLLAIPLSLAFLHALTPPTDIDGVYYHLTAPMRWLQHGKVDYLPTLMHTNMPMAVDMLFMLAMGIWSDTAAKLIHFAFGLLAILAIFALGRRSRGPGVGMAAVAVFLMGLPSARTFPVMTWAYVDMGIVAQLMASVLAWIVWRKTGTIGWLRAAAVFAGFAATCKLTVASAGIALAVMTAWEVKSQQKPFGESIKAGLGFIALFLLPVIPWMIRAAILTGNPVYPVLAAIIPTRNWSPDAVKAFEQFFRYYVWGTSGVGANWSLAKRKMVLLGCIGTVILAAALWLWRDKNRDTKALAAVSAIICVISLWSTGLYLRYFLPILPLAVIAILSNAGRSKQATTLGRAAVIGLLLMAGFTYRSEALRDLGKSVKAATGRMPREQYIQSAYPPYTLWDYISRSVPEDARVLQFAGRGSYYVRPYCYITEAIYQNVIRMDTWEHFEADIEREGITHLLLPKPGTNTNIGMEYAPAKNEADFAERLAVERGELIQESAGDRFFKLRPRSITASIK